MPSRSFASSIACQLAPLAPHEVRFQFRRRDARFKQLVNLPNDLPLSSGKKKYPQMTAKKATPPKIYAVRVRACTVMWGIDIPMVTPRPGKMYGVTEVTVKGASTSLDVLTAMIFRLKRTTSVSSVRACQMRMWSRIFGKTL